MADKIVICIPLHLQTRQEVADTLLNHYGTDYLFIGRIFQGTTINQSCAIDIYPHKVELAEAFALTESKIALGTIDKVAKHKQVVYLTSTDTGYQACLQMAKFAQVMLKIGGIAIKIDSADIVHAADHWLAHYNSSDVFDIYSLYVKLLECDRYYYSCGMHNFGKADVTIEIGEDIGLAIYVMNVFNYYRLTESPILQDGHTFQPDVGCPTYEMKWTADEQHERHSILHNPSGIWLLKPVYFVETIEN